jgi:hypothetical protein
MVDPTLCTSRVNSVTRLYFLVRLYISQTKSLVFVAKPFYAESVALLHPYAFMASAWLINFTYTTAINRQRPVTCTETVFSVRSLPRCYNQGKFFFLTLLLAIRITEIL